ncbi:MAG TPA: hypothetical protein VMU36_02255 [Spirochaetia bacterium]|nr:hypothetical protein [Spirochaetia bacterium]
MPRTLPPEISTADPGSYAQYAVTVRQPRIIQQVIESNQLAQSSLSALDDLGRADCPAGRSDVARHTLVFCRVLFLSEASRRDYRRMLEDRKWDTSLSLEDLASYFPAPFIALRTMKSELVVDVPRAQADRLSRADPRWMVNGRRGLVRFCRIRKRTQ